MQFRTTCLRNGAAHNGLHPPVLTKTKLILYRQKTDHADVGNTAAYQLGFFSQIILGYGKLTVKANQVIKQPALLVCCCFSSWWCWDLTQNLTRAKKVFHSRATLLILPWVTFGILLFIFYLKIASLKRRFENKDFLCMHMWREQLLWGLWGSVGPVSAEQLNRLGAAGPWAAGTEELKSPWGR